MKAWLLNARVASAIGFLVLIMLVWFLGPFFGLIAMEARFGGVIVVLLLWVASLLVGRIIARRANGLLEGLLRKQADDAVMNASSDTRAEVTLLRQRLLAAIDTIKRSKLGNATGCAALYELPWYMIIGHPAAGKSSAVLQSGLTFPFSDKSAIHGVGGTRNCDWFFSTEGVLLDTAGRYATQQEDRSEWLAFLKLLQKYRARAPVNGILIAISLPELAQHNSESFSSYARLLRERIHEIGQAFSLTVPIYLVFTKMDLLGGFANFFADSDESVRNQAWGFTLTANQDSGFDIVSSVSQQFDALYRGVVQMGEEKLAQYRGSEVKPAHFAFPIEFHGLKDAVVKFASLLQEDNPYHTKPLLRGFYFTSALQDSTPKIASASKVKSQFSLTLGSKQASKPEAGSHSYFLRDLFREVIFPDQHLISNQTRPGGTRLRHVTMFAGVGALMLLAGLWTWSFSGNRQFIEQLAHERVQVQQAFASTSTYEQLKGLALLQGRLEELESYRRQRIPWQIGFGLYQGNKIETRLRQEYFAKLRQLMLLPLRTQLETRLGALKPVLSAPVLVPTPAPPLAAPVIAPLPPRLRAPLKPVRPPRKQGGGLPNIDLGAWQGDRNMVVAGTQHYLMRTAFSRPALPPAASAVVAGAAAAKPAAAANANPAANPVPSPAPALDDGYNALKTYLMLQDRRRMEPAHLSDQIPRYWRPWLEAHRGEHSLEDMMAVAERLIAYYVNQGQAEDLPLIDNDAQLVQGAREVLKGSLKRMSAQERVYSDIKSRANTRYAPLTVARILENRDLDVVAGSQMVAGAFTREAWDGFVQKAIADASRGEIRSDDWVLATSIRDDLSQGNDSERNRETIEALYREQYIAEWKKFLGGLVIRDFTSPPQAAAAMTRLADIKSSPVKLLLQRAARETAWDNPSELHRSLANAKQSVLEKTTDFLSRGGGQDKADAPRHGVVGARFADLALLVSGDSPPIDGYLAQLNTVKARLNAIAGADNAGALARSTLQSTLNGEGSEMAAALAFVDNSLLAPVSADTKEAIRPILLRPLTQSYSSLLGAVGAEINQAWNAEVLPQWKQLSLKYPFSNSSNSATLAEISRFAKPGEGTLDRFINQYLNGLLVRRGNELQPRSWGNQGVTFDPAFLAGASKILALAGHQLQAGEAASFELQPQPAPGYAEISIEIDGQTLRYRNGPQQWQSFSWPGTGTAGARLQLLSDRGVTSTLGSQSGYMGWVRLVSGARVVSADDDTAVISFPVKKGTTDETEYINFNFRVVGGFNPLKLIALYKLSLPERVTL